MLKGNNGEVQVVAGIDAARFAGDEATLENLRALDGKFVSPVAFTKSGGFITVQADDDKPRRIPTMFLPDI